VSSIDPSAWSALVDGIRRAGDRILADDQLTDDEKSSGLRAVLRALNNHLGRFEVDRDRPEFVPFNDWREKMLMDNPDFRYWVADIRPDRAYRITGTLGDAVYQSVTAYRSTGTLQAEAIARIDSDELTVAPDGSFSVVLGHAADSASSVDEAAPQNWIPLPEGASSVWVRQFHERVRSDRLGTCRIESIDTTNSPPGDRPGHDETSPGPADHSRFAHQIERLGKAIGSLPAICGRAAAEDLSHPNQIRHWDEMSSGAAFTEPGIHYLRGSWRLDHDEVLVIEGDAVDCRYWSVLLYNRFLNSLDHRTRPVSYTGATARLDGSRFRFIVGASDPAGLASAPKGDWLDTEGNTFGIVVFRFLHPTVAPQLPQLSVHRVAT
jgi:hypothetical protein